jgi:DNA-directed RNA polymerase specialized sigma24 family protein
MEELELDMYLQSIIQDACSHLPDSPQRRKAINRLLRSIHTLGGIQRSGNDIYEQALYATMLNLTKTLCDRYDSDRGSFLAWFRTCVRNQYRDELRAEGRHRSRQKSIVRSDEGELDSLDRLRAPTDGKLLLDTWESFVKWIEDDPDNLLKACHIEHNPKANCQSIAYLKLVMGKEWQEIAIEVGSPSGSISSHWGRKCQPLLKEWLDQNQKLF